jgi:hypothetical protein
MTEDAADDDGARVAELLLFTPRWARQYSPGALGEQFAMTALFRREDGEEQEPFGILTFELLAELIAEMNPPYVTVFSALGENIEALQALVEKARAGGRVH